MFLIETKQEINGKQARKCSSTEGKRKVTVTVNCVTVKRKFQKERGQLRSAKF